MDILNNVSGKYTFGIDVGFILPVPADNTGSLNRKSGLAISILGIGSNILLQKVPENLF